MIFGGYRLTGALAQSVSISVNGANTRINGVLATITNSATTESVVTSSYIGPGGSVSLTIGGGTSATWWGVLFKNA